MKNAKCYKCHIAGTHFILIELVNLSPLSSTEGQGRDRTTKVLFSEVHYLLRTSCVIRQSENISWFYSSLYIASHTYIHAHMCTGTQKSLSSRSSSPRRWNTTCFTTQWLLLHLRGGFTYCQWPAPYKILAKHARSPLHYWESPCSHSPSWFVGTVFYLACTA